MSIPLPKWPLISGRKERIMSEEISSEKELQLSPVCPFLAWAAANDEKFVDNLVNVQLASR